MADMLINAEILLLPQDEAVHMAKVLRRSIDADGNIIGTFDENQNLNTLIYDVNFPDGAVKQYGADIIAENVLIQVDPHGYNSCLLDKLVLHNRMGNAVSKENVYVTTRRGVMNLCQTTIGWKFLCEWKDGSSSWVSLKVLKESHPIEVVEYVTALGSENEPAFAWWVSYNLKKRNSICSNQYSCLQEHPQVWERFLQASREPWPLIRRMETTFGRRPTKRKYFQSLLHSTFGRTMSPFLSDTRKRQDT